MGRKPGFIRIHLPHMGENERQSQSLTSSQDSDSNDTTKKQNGKHKIRQRKNMKHRDYKNKDYYDFFTPDEDDDEVPNSSKRIPKKRQIQIKAQQCRVRNGSCFQGQTIPHYEPASSDSDEVEPNASVQYSVNNGPKAKHIYAPNKRCDSNESMGKYATEFLNRCQHDRKMNSGRAKEQTTQYDHFGLKQGYVQTEHTKCSPRCTQTNERESGAKCTQTKEYRATRKSSRRVEPSCTKVHRRSKSCKQPKVTKCPLESENHVFPFAGRTLSGNLKVPPNMVSYESPRVSVLVSDPQKAVTKVTRYDKITCEPISEEVKKPETMPSSTLSTKESGPSNKKDSGSDDDNQGEGNLAQGPSNVSNTTNIAPQNSATSGPPPEPQDEPKKENEFQSGGETATEKVMKSETREPQWPISNYNANCFPRVNSSWENVKGEEEAYSKHRSGLNDKKCMNSHKNDVALKASFNTGSMSRTAMTNKREVELTNEAEFTELINRERINRAETYERGDDVSEKYCKSDKSVHFPSEMKGQNFLMAPNFAQSIHQRICRAIHADMKVCIGGEEFPCHGLPLQIYSKYFDQLKRPKETIMKIDLPPEMVSSEDFKNMMDWILLDDEKKVFVVNIENVVGLFSAAQYLQIPDLKKQCEAFIIDSVAEEDARILHLWDECHKKTNCGHLISILSSKLSRLFPQLYKSRQFLTLQVHELVTLLSSDNVRINSELEIFDAAVRWLLYEWVARNQYKARVMATVRFGLLSPLQLTQIRHFTEDESMPDYTAIFRDEQVNRMFQQGLTYAILRESYKDKHADREIWIKKSGVIVPRERTSLDAGYNESETGNTQKLKFCGKADRKEGTEHSNDAGIGIQNDNDWGINSSFQSNLSQDVNENLAEKPSENFVENSNGEYIEVKPHKARLKASLVIQRKVREYLWKKQIRETAAIQIQRAWRSFSQAKKSYDKTADKTEDTFLSLSNAHVLKNMDVINSVVLLFGGFNPNELYSSENNARSVYLYTVDSDTWKQIGEMPEPKSHFGIVKHSGFLYMFGGSDPRKKNRKNRSMPTRSTWKLDLRNGKWTQLAPMNIARNNFGYALHENFIYVFGGNDAVGDALSLCEKYDIENDKWTWMEPMDGPRLSMGVAVHQEKIWISGGCTKIRKYPVLSSVICYDPKKNEWMECCEMPQARAFHTMVSYENHLYIIAGAGLGQNEETKSQSLASIIVLDSKSESWRPWGELLEPRHGHNGAIIGNKLVIMGGVSSFQMKALNTVEIFDMTTSQSAVGNRMHSQMSGIGLVSL